MTILTSLGLLIAGYLIGNISFAYYAGRIFGGFDIREKGSGNAGATNVIRVLGWKIGIGVFVLDALKGLAAAAIGLALGGEVGAMLAAFGVVLGHDFPVFLNFRGGKGIASTTGIFLFLFPLPALGSVLLFILIVLVSRWVSLGSLVFVSCVLAYVLVSGQPTAYAVLAAGLTLFAFLRHSANIQRLLRGEENRLSLGG